MEIFLFNAEILETNNYLCYDKNSKEAILIDCSADIYEVKNKVEELGANLKAILLTHGHFDHVMTTLDAKKYFPETKIYISKNDKLFLDNIDKQTEHFGIPTFEIPDITDFIDENSEFYLGEDRVEIIETPGHSAGSLSFKINETIFSGDTLFLEAVGRCDLPTGDFSVIRDSIVGKLFALDGDYKVFSGHGAPTTMEYERLHNAYFGSNAQYSL